MGIDINSRIIQGATAEDWVKALEGREEEFGIGEDESVYDFLSEAFDYISPYYDSDRDHQCYGIKLFGGDWTVTVGLEALTEKAKEAEKSLMDEYGIKTYLCLGAHVW